MMELFIECLRFAFLLTLLLLIPLALLAATPFVLLWPRSDKREAYGRAVWRRYGRVLRAMRFVDWFGGATD